MQFNARPVSEVVTQLADATHQSLSVDQKLENEIVVVSVTDVKPDELMTNLAVAVGGKWVEREGAKKLIVDQNALANARTKRMNDFVTQWKAAITKMLNDKGDNAAIVGAGFGGGGGGVSLAVAGAGGGSKAGNAAILKLIQQIDPRQVAGIGDGERFVYALTPNRMQRALPGNAQQVLRDLVIQHNAELTAAEKEKQKNKGVAEDENSEEQAALAPFIEMFGGGGSEKPITDVEEASLVISKGGGFFGFRMLDQSSSLLSGINIDLRLYNKKGEVAFSATMPMEGIDFSQFTELMEPPKPKPAGAKPETEVKFSEISTEYQSLQSVGMAAGGGQPVASEKLRAQLMRPDQHDPLSFVHGESLITAATKKNLDVVAWIPDSSVSLFGSFMARSSATTVESVLDGLAKAGTKVVETNGWLLVQQDSIFDPEYTRVDRMAVTGLIRATRDRVLPNLDDMATYARYNPSPLETPVVMKNLMVFAPNSISQGMKMPTNWNMLRFYGLLTTTQRDMVKQGKSLLFGGLTGEQRNMLFKIMYGTDANLKIASEEKPTKKNGGFMDMITAFLPSMIKSFRQEPTEAMPNGLEPQGEIMLKVDAKQVIVNTKEGKPDVGMMGAAGIEEIAMLKYFASMEQMSAMMPEMPSFDNVVMGNRFDFEFKFFGAPGTYVRHELSDYAIDKASKPTSFNALPSSFLEAVNARVEELKKSPMPMFGTSVRRKL